MADIPRTSITLLKALAGDASSSRWTEFYHRYEEPMRGFLHANYPSLEPEDVIQETLVALLKCLPNYHYTPDEKGHFRNYLMGILRHKAVDALRRRVRESEVRAGSQALGETDYQPAEDDSWKLAALETAIEQLMADDTLSAQTRSIFRHVALMHEKPEAVAAQFGVTRNNIDQIKSRLIARLSELVRTMTENL